MFISFIYSPALSWRHIRSLQAVFPFWLGGKRRASLCVVAASGQTDWIKHFTTIRESRGKRWAFHPRHKHECFCLFSPALHLQATLKWIRVRNAGLVFNLNVKLGVRKWIKQDGCTRLCSVKIFWDHLLSEPP